MGMLEDLMKALERIPLWKQVSALPATVSALEARIAALEARLDTSSGSRCPMCQSSGFMRTGSKPDPAFGALGVMLDMFSCPGCGHHEARPRDTLQK